MKLNNINHSFLIKKACNSGILNFFRKAVFLIPLFGGGGALAQLKPNGVTAPAPATAVVKPANYPTTGTINYVRTREATAPITSEANFAIAGFNQVKETTQYIDGLGRPVQTIVKQGSPNGKDLVSPQVYDEFGREVYKYLPYESIQNTGGFITNPFVQQETFAQSQYPGEQVYYGYTQFEASPINRPLRTLAPGNSWAGSNRGVSMSYEINTLADDVKIFNITNGTYSIAGAYPTGQLYKTITTDEHGKKVKEFKNKDGQVILKQVQIDNSPTGAYSGWLSTYYIYDDFGLLSCVIPPKGVDYLISNSWASFSTPSGATGVGTWYYELCFFYNYDTKLRMISKKVPGAAEVLMVYDQRDRLVLTQDGNMRANNQWLASAYDNFNRPIRTGMFSSTLTQVQLQTAANTSINYPATTSWASILTATFYDNYNFISTEAFPITGSYQNLIGADAIATPYTQGPDFAMPLTQSNLTKGMVTGSYTTVLGSTTKLYSVTIYDAYGRPIQAKTTNITGGTDIVTNQGDYAGKPLRTHSQNQKAGSNPITTTQLVKNTYDIAGRLTQTSHRLNNFNEVTIAKLTYDAMGQLVKKELGQKRINATTYDSVPLETLDYSYNIRGWLKGVNENYLNTNANFNNSRWFGFQLNYDYGFNNSIGGLSTPADLFNGNISGMVWKNRGSDKQRAYGFAYDNANRLLKSDFTEKLPSLSGAINYSNADNIDVSTKMGDGLNYATAYDANGNILRMQQKGLLVGNSSLIDDLLYTYYSNSNKLKNVIDMVNEVSSGANGYGDFHTNNNSANYNDHYNFVNIGGNPNAIVDYTYDANGNLRKDENKLINNINYNYLNLPQNINVTNTTSGGNNTVSYIYDANGNKLQKIVTEIMAQNIFYNNQFFTSDITTTTTYISGAVYETKQYSEPALAPLNFTDALQYINTSEGKVKIDSVNGNSIAVYDYLLKDHLGNVRTILSDEIKADTYRASYEANNISFESSFVINGNVGKVNRPSCFGYPTINGVNNATVQRLGNRSLGGRRGVTNDIVGSMIGIKVMAGDTIKANVLGWFQRNVETNDPNANRNGLESMVANFLTSAIWNTGTKGNAQWIEPNNLTTTVSDFYSLVSQPNYTNDAAYLNWMLIDDETFKIVNAPNANGFTSLSSATSGNGCSPAAMLQMNGGTGVVMPRNGYLFVFTSNTSTNYPVYFDELIITHNRGPLKEENAYYPFGLPINSISSKAALANFGPKATGNKLKYNGKEEQRQEFSDGSGLEWVDYGNRMYDCQIGRWHVQDRYAGKYFSFSPYSYAVNNPTNVVDIRGDSIEIIIGRPYKDKNGEDHPYGHMALRVFNSAQGYDMVYDFGRYGETWGLGGSEGEGILNVYSDSKSYLASEMSDRNSIGYSKGTSVEDDKKIIGFFDKMIKEGTPTGNAVPGEGGKAGKGTQYKLKDNYDIFNNNCATKSRDGLAQIGINWFDTYKPNDAVVTMERTYKALDLTRTDYRKGGDVTVTYQAGQSQKLKTNEPFIMPRNVPDATKLVIRQPINFSLPKKQ